MRSWTDTGAVDVWEGGREVLRPLRVFWSVHVVWLGLVGATGCGGARSDIDRAAAPSLGTVITADVIAASGARTAWDAVRFTVPNVQLRESRGKPARILRRGRSSIYLDDQVRVVIDDVPVHDVTVLEQIPASDILTIRLLSGLDAATFYGGTSTTGLIVVRTKNGSR